MFVEMSPASEPIRRMVLEISLVIGVSLDCRA
jgi:hypothetical protein